MLLAATGAVFSRALSNVIFLSISSEVLPSDEFNVLAIGFLYASVASFVVDNGSAVRDLSRITRDGGGGGRPFMLRVVGQKLCLLISTLIAIVPISAYLFGVEVAVVLGALLVAQGAYVVVNNAAVSERVKGAHVLDGAISTTVTVSSLIIFLAFAVAGGLRESAVVAALTYGMLRLVLCSAGALLYYLRAESAGYWKDVLRGVREPFAGWDYGVAYILGGLYLNIGALVLSHVSNEESVGAYIFTERFFYAGTMGTVALLNVFAPRIYNQVLCDGHWAGVKGSLDRLQAWTVLTCGVGGWLVFECWGKLASLPGLRMVVSDPQVIASFCVIVVLRYSMVRYQLVINYVSRATAKVIPILVAGVAFGAGTWLLHGVAGLVGVALANVASHAILFGLLIYFAAKAPLLPRAADRPHAPG